MTNVVSNGYKDKFSDKTLFRFDIMTKHKIELTESINPDIIGGYILRWGDEQVDASISRKLRELRKQFKPNLYLKDF